MTVTLTKEQVEHAEDLKQRYIAAAYRRECKTGKAPIAISTPRTVQEAVKKLTGMDDYDSFAAAIEIESDATTPLASFINVLPGLSDAAVNYLFSSVSYRYFATKYLPHVFYRPFSELYHDEYFKIIRSVETHTVDTPVVVAGPRDWGKTAIGSMMLPIHAVVFPVVLYYPGSKERDISKRFIALITAALGNAQRLLGSVCSELEENDLIRQDFGEFYKDPDRRPGQRDKPWSKTVAVTMNDKRLEAFSRGSKIRGAFWKGYRPDLGIGDDLEDDEAVDQSALVRDRNYRWLTNTLVNCFSKENGNLLLLGNLVHIDGLIGRLVKYAQERDWPHKVFRVSEKDEDTGEKVYLWEEEFGKKFEKDKREVITDEGFELEFQMNPEAYAQELTSKSFSYYTLADIEGRMGSLFIYSAIDPAATVGRRSDNTAVVSIAYDDVAKRTYVLPKPFIGKIPVKDQADLVLRVAGKWDPVTFGIEAVAYQTALDAMVNERATAAGLAIRTQSLTQGSGVVKRKRIAMRLNGRIDAGQILFLMDDPLHAVLMDELINLRNPGVKDDAADALEMAVRLKDEEFVLNPRVFSGARVRAVYNTAEQQAEMQAATKRRLEGSVHKMQEPHNDMISAIENERRDSAGYRRQGRAVRSYVRVAGIKP